MSAMASMKMRPFSLTASQLGAQVWLMKRASLPPTEASITVSSSTAKSTVWWFFMPSSS
jgi:hypothetical protein